jgi:hypothetical protein
MAEGNEDGGGGREKKHPSRSTIEPKHVMCLRFPQLMPSLMWDLAI